MSLDRWLIVFAVFLIHRAEPGKAGDAYPAVDELVQRVIAQEQTDRRHQAGLEYSFALTTEHYDAKGQRTSAQTVRATAKAKASIEFNADSLNADSQNVWFVLLVGVSEASGIETPLSEVF